MPPISPFTLLDYRQQLAGILKPGLLMRMMHWLGGSQEIIRAAQGDRGGHQQLGMIDAMTPQERTHPQLIDRERAQRIACGAGVPSEAVFRLLKYHETMGEMLQKLQQNPPGRGNTPR